MKNLVVLISHAGTGSNLQAILDAIKAKKINATVQTVISDKEDAKGLEKAKNYNIPSLICQSKENLLPILYKLQPDYVVLAGWKQIISEEVIDSYPNKILNLHPGIIPDTMDGTMKNPDGTDALWNKGMFTDIAIRNILSNKATYAGSSIHVLTHEFDFGPVLERTFEKTEPSDTIETLYARLKQKENKLYVEVLIKLCNR
ncbi:MAG: formyltransferase family protein [bacterium]|nr:formyltransferase family protein [bacterium]